MDISLLYKKYGEKMIQLEILQAEIKEIKRGIAKQLNATASSGENECERAD